MKTRSITSIFIVLITVAFFFLREIDYRFFDLFVYAIAILCSIELTKAYGERLPKLNKIIIISFTAIIFPIAVFFSTYLILAFSFLIITAISIVALADKSNKINKISFTALALLYPTLPLLSLVIMNSLAEMWATYLLVMVFAITWLTDVGAYLVGSWLKGKKLCPSISPNKTVSGAIGGVIFGAIASVAVYFIFSAFKITFFADAKTISVVLFLIMTGILFSISTQIGDLLESVIKRKLGVKDMGNFMPGHGGMLDRVDGLSITSLLIFVVYSLLL